MEVTTEVTTELSKEGGMKCRVLTASIALALGALLTVGCGEDTQSADTGPDATTTEPADTAPDTAPGTTAPDTTAVPVETTTTAAPWRPASTCRACARAGRNWWGGWPWSARGRGRTDRAAGQ